MHPCGRIPLGGFIKSILSAAERQIGMLGSSRGEWNYTSSLGSCSKRESRVSLLAPWGREVGEEGGYNSPKASLLKSGQQKRIPKPLFAQKTHVVPLFGLIISLPCVAKLYLPLSVVNLNFLWGHKASSYDKPHQNFCILGPPNQSLRNDPHPLLKAKQSIPLVHPPTQWRSCT